MGWWNRGRNNKKNKKKRARRASAYLDDHISETGDPDHTNDYSEVDSVEVDDDESGSFDSNDDNGDDDESDMDEWEGRPMRHLMWQDDNHVAVLTQVYGSVWPRAISYCCLNAAICYLVFYLKEHHKVDLTVSPSGHKYMATLMSFLLVTRLKITFDNYMSNAKNLSTLNKAVRDLVANACLLTANDKHKRAKMWRQDVTYSTLVMLRVAIAVLEYRTKGENPWLLDEMNQENGEEVHRYSFKKDISPTAAAQGHRKGSSLRDSNVLSPSVAQTTDGILKQGGTLETYDAVLSALPELSRDNTTQHDHDEELLDLPSLKQRLAHVADEERNIVEEASRAVYCLAMNLRREILKQRDGTWFKDRDAVWQHPCNEETRLLDFVAEFLKAFAGLYKLITTPLPLPLLQMNKIFLFVWLFTLPMCIMHAQVANFSRTPAAGMILVFVITFGFLGLEFTAMELTDPFGNDPSDFDGLGEAQVTMEDCYISIYRADGIQWVKALRKRVKPKDKKESMEEFENEFHAAHAAGEQQQEESPRVTFWDDPSPKTHLA
mmetsp:Transcript_18895/g.44160  ORF Transcript_18895/g.44160 Transcript_18895/m.44160 type:complete len:548 (+) Transcript_18895:232-1875(+)